MFMFLWLCCMVAFGEQPKIEVNESIVVEAHKDFEVYVAPIVFKNHAPEIEAVIGDNTVFKYASSHSKMAKIQSGYRSYEPMNQNHDDFKVYDQNTIKYVWEECNYILDSKKCTFQNNHFLLETYITIDVNQLIVEMLLYDSDLQVIASGTTNSNLKVTWIKQQEVTTNVNESGIMPQQQVSQNSCNKASGACPPSNGFTQNSGNYRREVQTSMPKEELPLKWEIPHKLLDFHINQTSLRLWTGVKIDLD